MDGHRSMPRPNSGQYIGLPHLVKVSQRFLVLSIISSILVAFAIGRTARILLVVKPQQELLLAQQDALADLFQRASAAESSTDQQMKLPTPVLQSGKVLPQTTYTSKMFDTALPATIISRWIVTDEGRNQCVDLPDHECQTGETAPPAKNSIDDDAGEDEEAHMPQGQHLLIDIENVDGAFLNSAERLATAMLDLVNECGLTLLSYHCHSMTPMGVSCAGVLLESHISFHTWPTEGVITLDLFTCGDASLLPIVSLAENLFSVPKDGGGTQEKPQMVWAHKYRGFNDNREDDVAGLTDFFNFPIGRMTDYKAQVVSADTDFQKVDIVDVLRPQYQNMEDYKKSLAVDGSYEAAHPELFEPDRLVFLDGVVQSRRTGDAAYHEALVHPGMFAHANPKRVAIIGGGEGATLREILKHNTVDKVVMIEIDRKMVDLSREYLPFWSDCSMLQGGTASCFDDPRVEVYYEDAFAWFIDRYGGGSSEKSETEEPFDVIIMDALDPQIQKDFVDALYDGGPFLGSLPKAISKDGIFVAQVGAAPELKSPPEDHSLNKNRVNFIRSLVDLGFESIRDYEEGHGGFTEPWQIIVAFKSYDTKAQWFVDSSLIEYKIRQRMTSTTHGVSPLLHFDGATMVSYNFPSKTSEVVYCRRPNSMNFRSCLEGHGFDPELTNFPSSVLEVRQSTLGEMAGRGLFTTVDIPKDSYIGLEGLVHSVYMEAYVYNLVITMNSFLGKKSFRHLGSLASFAHRFGGKFSHRGMESIYVASTSHIFCNHGCNGTNNVGHDLSITEQNVNPMAMPLSIKMQDAATIYNPSNDRQVHFYSGGYPRRDIVKDEELFDNYLGMVGKPPSNWFEDVMDLRGQCHGTETGEVTKAQLHD